MTTETPRSAKRPFAHVLAGLTLTALASVYVIGVPVEQTTRAENAELREEIRVSQTELRAAAAEVEHLRELKTEKTQKLAELQSALASTDGFVQ